MKYGSQEKPNCEWETEHNCGISAHAEPHPNVFSDPMAAHSVESAVEQLGVHAEYPLSPKCVNHSMKNHSKNDKSFPVHHGDKTKMTTTDDHKSLT